MFLPLIRVKPLNALGWVLCGHSKATCLHCLLPLSHPHVQSMPSHTYYCAFMYSSEYSEYTEYNITPTVGPSPPRSRKPAYSALVITPVITINVNRRGNIAAQQRTFVLFQIACPQDDLPLCRVREESHSFPMPRASPERTPTELVGITITCTYVLGAAVPSFLTLPSLPPHSIPHRARIKIVIHPTSSWQSLFLVHPAVPAPWLFL